jgi:hypothetical protein
MGDVVDISKKRKEKQKEEKEATQETLDLEAVAKKNEENRRRIEKERLDANKGVLRTYRIKSKNNKKK